MEWDLQPRADNGPVPDELMRWWSNIDRATKQNQRPISYQYGSGPNPVSSRARLLEELGAVDIREETVKVPLSTKWSTGTRSGLKYFLSRWYGTELTDDCQGLDALSAAAFSRYGAEFPQPWERQKWVIRDAILNLETEVYNVL